MPTYTYYCPKCNQHAPQGTRTVAIEDRNNQYCACGWKLQRLWDAPAIAFKGTGFYINDSKRKP